MAKRAAGLIGLGAVRGGFFAVLLVFVLAGVIWILAIGRDPDAASDFLHAAFGEGAIYGLWILGALMMVLKDLQNRQPAAEDEPRTRASRHPVGTRETIWGNETFEVVEVCRHSVPAEHAEGCSPLRKKWRRVSDTDHARARIEHGRIG